MAAAAAISGTASAGGKRRTESSVRGGFESAPLFLVRRGGFFHASPLLRADITSSHRDPPIPDTLSPLAKGGKGMGKGGVFLTALPCVL